MRDRDRYLKQRDKRFHYVRRVPLHVSDVDKRGTVRLSLKTDNIVVARKKRDQLEEADDLFWLSLVGGEKQAAFLRYQAAVERIETVSDPEDTANMEAVLGGVARPRRSLRDAFDLYVGEIAASELAGKSPSQRASWKKVKLRAVNNFIKVVGDIPLWDINRRLYSRLQWPSHRESLSTKSEQVHMVPRPSEWIGKECLLVQPDWVWEDRPVYSPVPQL